jgi:hypothetical protein
MRRAAVVLVMLTLASCGDNRSASFKTLQEAEASGLIEKGWIPPEVPPDATDIRVRWNLDTNVSKGSYRSKSLVAEHGDSKCRPTQGGPGMMQCGSFYFQSTGDRRTFSTPYP